MSTTAFTNMVHNLEAYITLLKNPQTTKREYELFANNVLEQIRVYEQSML